QSLVGLSSSRRGGTIQPAAAVSESPAQISTAPVLAATPAATEEPVKDPADSFTAGNGGARRLEDLHNAAAIQASLSLSQLMGQEIRVSFPESRLVPLTDVAPLIGGDEATVGGIYVGIGGDINGGALLVFPEKSLLSVDDMLHGRPAGTRRELADVDLSGLSEMGNILAACFINPIADAARLRVQPEVPETSVDMCLPVIDSVLARFNQPGDRILLTEAVIYGADMRTVVCHQLLFLEPDSFQRLLRELTVDHGAALAAARG
ncbi:MAG TPA: chemotaxis protein CheC, partial [Spirochaetia bacterium]|nr:chemotaxis protein CheC [Spirochaetia bacterium]